MYGGGGGEGEISPVWKHRSSAPSGPLPKKDNKDNKKDSHDNKKDNKDNNKDHEDNSKEDIDNINNNKELHWLRLRGADIFFTQE